MSNVVDIQKTLFTHFKRGMVTILVTLHFSVLVIIYNALSLFHNWCSITLQHLAIEFFWLCTSYRTRCTNSRICCMRCCGRTKYPQNCGHANYAGGDQIRSKSLNCNARASDSPNVLQHFYTHRSDARFLRIVR